MSKGLVTSGYLFKIPRAPQHMAHVILQTPKARRCDPTWYTHVPVSRCQEKGLGASAKQGDFSWAQVPIQPRCCAETQLRSGAAEPSIRGGPAASPLQILLLLTVKSGRKLPGPHFPSPNGVIEFHQSYRDISYFSSITKATFESLTDIFIGTDYKD